MNQVCTVSESLVERPNMGATAIEERPESM